MSKRGTVKEDRPVLLVADDDSELLFLMKQLLQSQGFAIRIAQNAGNIIDMIIQDPPDMILLDINMDRIDGGTVCRLLKTNNSTAGIPIILISGNDNIEQISKQSTADGCIKKPFDAGRVRLEYLRITENRASH